MNHSFFNLSTSQAAGSLVAALAMSAAAAFADDNPAQADQMAQYEAAVPKTIVELQPFRQQQTSMLANGTKVTLISLNPHINATFLLTIGTDAYHIENPDPDGQKIVLAEQPFAVIHVIGPATTTRCDLWGGATSEFQIARESGLPYAPLCGARLYLRNAIPGSRSSLERVTDFLRDHIWQGDKIVTLVKDTFYSDEYAETTTLVETSRQDSAPDGPQPALIEARYLDQAITPYGFGIAMVDPKQKQMSPGVWYSAAGVDGVFVSAIQPRTISAEILNGPGSANRLDSIEGKAVDYLVAFDMTRYGVGFALGTDHPRLDWSPRPRAQARIPGLPGPDGIGDALPLVRSGMVSPDFAVRTIATFVGGFKRQHGAFKFGDYAVIDTGKHYGFIEKGVIYSKLKQELSTLYVLDDGTTEMKTWKAADDALLPRIMFARQNGVPLIETNPVTGIGMPGDRVTQWGPGNWSGSAEAELRTLRAGACMQETGARRYLIYGYFSTATPSAMARVFQAYGCKYAMLLDMNAPELTYLALYPRQDGNVHVEHLISVMSQFDKTAPDGNIIPRFLGYPDSRDLFFIYRRGEAE
ncbi:MAG: hypothetical protein KDA67_05390 [Rhodobacteraceae bacterium]|nr:hypothetical protein [Paracoccaceae bacterium]